MNFLSILKEARTIDESHVALNVHEGLISQKILATVVGGVALFLPHILYVVDRWNGLSCQQDSLSHYYFVPGAGDVFVLSLAIVGVVLFAYRGENRIDARVASIAGLAACLVALFPTSGLGCDPALTLEIRQVAKLDKAGAFVPHALPDWFSKVHYGAAAFVLVALTYFAGWSFTRVLPGRDRDARGRLTPRKATRNTIYLLCAAAMAVGLAVFVLDFTEIMPDPLGRRSAYWAEFIILTAFGISWFIKGNRFFGLLSDDETQTA